MQTRSSVRFVYRRISFSFSNETRDDRLKRNHEPGIVEPPHTTRRGDSVQSESSTNVPGRRWIRWILLLSVTLVAFTAVLVPALLIQPFKLQTAERLNISYSLRHWSPIITLLALSLALLIVSRCGDRPAAGGVKGPFFLFSFRSSWQRGWRDRTISNGCSNRFRTPPLPR